MNPHKLFLTLMAALAVAFTGLPGYAAGDDKKGGAEKPAEKKADEDKPPEKKQPAGKKPEAKVVVPADRPDLVAGRVGKAIIVRGTVESVDLKNASGHGYIKFKEGDVVVFIRKANLEKHKDWGLDARVGKKVFVAGQAGVYKGKLQVTIIGPDQIAGSAEGFAMAKIPLPDKKEEPVVKKTGPAAPGAIAPTKKDYPEIELKLEEASVYSVIFYPMGLSPVFSKDNPFGKNPFNMPDDALAPSLAEVTATVKKTPGYGPMQVAFPKPNPQSVDKIRALLDELAKTYSGWPQDTLVTIDVDFDIKGTKDDPSVLTIATLLHSLIKGQDLASNLVISGDLGDDFGVVPPAANVDGVVSNGQILKAIGEDGGESMRFVRAPMGYAELNDFALDNDWETLVGVTVLTVPTLSEALRVAFATNVSSLGEALNGFEQAQQVIKKGTGAQMVRNKHVQQRVMAAGKALNTNQSAVFYAMYARGKVARTYSPERSHTVLKAYHDRLRGLLNEMPADAKEQFRELEDQQKEIRPKFDRDLALLLRALDDFHRTISNAVLKTKDGRALERQQEDVKEADEKVVAQLEALAAKIRGETVEAE